MDIQIHEAHPSGLAPAAKAAPCLAPYATYTLASGQAGAPSVTVADLFVAAT